MSNMKYSIFIFFGAASYGILAPVVKLAYQAGYAVHEVTGSQYLFGLLFLILIFPFIKKIRLSLKQIVKLMLVGTFLSLTGILYGLCLNHTPASVAIVLLFQFTWIGIVFDSIYSKQWPSKEKIISIIFLIAGTLFASNLISSGHQEINLGGMVYGLLAAVSYASFIFASGKVAVEVPSLQRSLFFTLGGLLLIMIVFGPSFITADALVSGLWKYGLLVAFFGAILPIIAFSVSAPKLDGGIVSILGSSELPAAIIAAMIVLGEKISVFQLIGILLILVGVCIPQLRYFSKKLRMNIQQSQQQQL